MRPLPGGGPVPAAIREIELEEKLAALQRSAVCAIHQVLALRDPEVGSHNALVAELCIQLAEKLELDEAAASALEAAALVHDVGMISLPDGLLRKASAFSPEERLLLSRHPEEGWSVLRQIAGLDTAALIVLHHHERWDGTGYPGRLRGEDIPLGSRILAVADAFGAMTSDRPHRRAMTPELAIQQLILESGKQFDPKIVRTFVREHQRSVRVEVADESSASAPVARSQPETRPGRANGERLAEELIDGKYRIVSRLGAGGMGEVYVAVHIYLNTTRVIKVVGARYSEDPEAHSRFLREARLATRVDHSNVARLYEFGRLPDGSMYMVWEFIDGQSMADRLHLARRLDVGDACALIVQALRGLHAIHQAGIIHRDISPENLMITRSESGDDRVVVIDLGVAKSLANQADDQADHLTSAGTFLGKPLYASPEQFGLLSRSEVLDLRTDLYSIAVVLFELVTGHTLVDASFDKVAIQHFTGETERLAKLPDDIPGAEALNPVLQRALRRDRTQRFSTALEFAEALEGVLRLVPPAPRHAARPATLASRLHWRTTERIL